MEFCLDERADLCKLTTSTDDRGPDRIEEGELTERTGNTRSSFAALVALALLTSCANPALRESIDQTFALSKDTVHENRAPIPWEVGQWVLLRLTSASGGTLFRWSPWETRGYRKLSITGREGSAFWLEEREVWPDEESQVAVLLDNVEQGDLSKAHVVKIRFKNEAGQTVEVDAADTEDSAAVEIRDRFQIRLSTYMLRTGVGRTRDVTVPAGTFKDTHAVPVSRILRTGRWVGNTWFTHAVPIIEFAKMTTRAETIIFFYNELTDEVVDFGLTGAETEL